MYSCCCIDVDDGPSVFSQVMRTAQKTHVCGECGHEIQFGEKYEDYRGCYEGKWSKHRTCWFCVRVREDYFKCGWYFENLREDFRECNGWDYAAPNSQFEEDDDD